MSQALICIVPGIPETDAIITNLRTAGFEPHDISVLVPDKFGAGDLAYEMHTKAPEGIAIGLGVGILLGSICGLVVVSGVVSLPLFSAIAATGSIFATLICIAIAVMLGSLIGGVIGIFIPEYEVKQYESRIREGNILLSVHTENNHELQRAEMIVKKEAASNIHYIDEKKVA
ncbi:MAG: hypothetical protein K2W82_09670 [Candidatus Obscuribacterales bacterium]|nr:hypothetical protein [Candidatus Obscuribacterales bacterium]